MSRFYQSGKPDFVENFMYTPPWELAQQALAYNDKGISDTIQAASLFNNINIDYIPDPVEKANVERELGKYSSKADEYSRNMQLQLQNSPQSWKKYAPQLQTLSTDLSKNLKTGNLAKIQQSAAAFAKWKEDNKDVAEKDPNFYNAGLNYFVSKWQANPNRSLDSTFTGDNLSKFDINGKDIMAGFEKFESDMKSRIGGDGYIYDTEGVTRDRVISAYMNKVFSDPQAQAYMKQAIAFKMPGFVDEKGQPIKPLVPIDKITGEQIPEDVYERDLKRFPTMTKAQKAREGRGDDFWYTVGPNKDFAWSAAFNSLADVKAGMKQTIKADSTYMDKLKLRQDKELAYARIAASLQMHADEVKKRDEENTTDKIINRKFGELKQTMAENPPGSAEYNKAKKEYDKIKATLPQEVNDASPYSFNYFQEKLSGNTNTDEYAYVRNNNRSFLSSSLKEMGLGEVTEVNNLKNPRDFYKAKVYGKGNEDLVKFIVDSDRKLKSGKAKETEELAKSYLRKKGYTDNDFYVKKTKDQILEETRKRTVSEDVKTPLFSKYLNTLNKYADLKKKKIDEFNSVYTKVEQYGLSKSGEETLKKKLLSNITNLNVKPLDLKSGNPPSVADLLEDGTILGTTKDGRYGVTTRVNYKDGRTYAIAGAQTRVDNNNMLKKIYDDSSLYEGELCYTAMHQAINGNIQSMIPNFKIELQKGDHFYIDNRNKDAAGKGLRFSTMAVPVGKDDAVDIRYYPDINKYSLVDSDGRLVEQYDDLGDKFYDSLTRILESQNLNSDTQTVKGNLIY